MNSLSLSFNNVNLTPVPQNDGQIWLSSGELAQALGYKSVDSVTKIYNRNSDEFTEKMTQVIDSLSDGQIDRPKSSIFKTRIFSLRGCHLISMFARTAIAKQFRKWVLDILDKEVTNQAINPHQDLHFQIPDIIHELVSQGVAAKGTLYNRLYRRFNVNSYKDIPLEQGQAAIEYLKRMASIYSQKLPVILNDGEHYFVVKDGVVIWEKVLKSNCDDIPVNTLKNPALMLEHIRQVVGEFIGKGALPAPKPVLIADFSKNSVFEHKYQGRRYVLSLDVFGNGYGWEGNPLRRLFALLKQAKKDGTTVAVNDIEGAELVFSTTESLARQYKDSLDSVSRHAANASNTACYLPLQGC